MTRNEMLVYGFETSNNLKVRLALAHKRIPYRFHAIDPADRTEIVRISGQFLTPVLVDGETVLFDSAAILRYLDANFPETPKLFGRNRTEQWEIEDWERFGRGALAEPMMTVVHTRVTGGGVPPRIQADARASFLEAVRLLEGRLDGRRFIVGDSLTAADITCGAVIYRIRSGGLFPFPADCPRCVEWSDRVMTLLP